MSGLWTVSYEENGERWETAPMSEAEVRDLYERFEADPNKSNVSMERKD